MDFAVRFLFILIVWTSANAAVLATFSNQHAHGIHGHCQMREEETFFLSKIREYRENKIFRKSNKCNDTIITRNAGSIDSICPYQHVLVENPCRNPSVTMEVQCAEKIVEIPESPGVTFKCKEVHFYRWVQARHQNVTGWIWKLYPVTVGCTALRVKVTPLNGKVITNKIKPHKNHGRPKRNSAIR